LPQAQEDFVFASPYLEGKQPLWGQTMNAKFVKPDAIELGLIADGDRSGWHRFRHSLSTWANETTKVQPNHASSCQARHHGDLHARELRQGVGQRMYMDQLLKMKPASESTQ
jgi:hypothetical protein